MRMLATTCLMALLGCSGMVKTVRAPSQPLALTTVFVYPLRLVGGTEPAWRHAEWATRMLASADRTAGASLAFYGPSEFKVLKPESDDAWVATSALPLLVTSGSRPDQGLVIRPSLERRVTSSSQEANSLSTGKQAAASSNEVTTWVGRIDVLHPSTKEVLFEAESSVVIDPFAQAPAEAEYDPAPAVTTLLEKLMAEAAQVAQRHAAERATAPLGPATFGLTPAWALQGDESSGGGDPLLADLLRLNIGRVLNPQLTEAQANGLASKPAGMVVLTSPEGSRLKAGDVVESIDGQPALPHVMSRVRFKGAPAELKVRRADGSATDVVFPLAGAR